VDLATNEFFYRLPGKVSSTRPGAHKSNSRGAGMNFVSHANLFDQPDPRRLDLRASVCSTHKNWLVRVNQQRAAISVAAIVDVSSTMHFGSSTRKLDVAADFLLSLGNSTSRLGDSVGLYAFDEVPREDLTQAPRFSRGIGQTMDQQIRNSQPTSRVSTTNPHALAHCIESASSRASLIFLISDYHWSLDTLSKMLTPLVGSQVVPLVIWDRAEVTPPAGNRLLSLRQLGSRAKRHLWLSPAVRDEWRSNVSSRQQSIAESFMAFNTKPFFITEGFSAQALSEYFMESSAR